MRTTKAVVEENVLESRDAGPRLTAWIVHHAAQVICACMVGTDGLTPFRWSKGRKFGTPLAGFGSMESCVTRDPFSAADLESTPHVFKRTSRRSRSC